MQDAAHALLLAAERLADQILHHRVGGRDDPVICKVVEELAEQVERLGAEPGQLLCPLKKLLALGDTAHPVAEQLQDDVTLVRQRGRGGRDRAYRRVRRKVTRKNRRHIVGDLGEGEGEELLPGLEVAELEDEADL